MAELAGAAAKLQDALDRLETVVDAKAEQGAELRAALEAAKQENVALQETADQVADRLDHAVTKLKDMLEA